MNLAIKTTVLYIFLSIGILSVYLIRKDLIREYGDTEKADLISIVMFIIITYVMVMVSWVAIGLLQEYSLA